MRKITLDTLQQYAKSKNGLCLSEKYVNARTPIKWQCCNGHIWETPLVYDGRWCRKCHFDSIRDDINMAQQIAIKNNGICLSKKYVNSNTKLKWKCNKGHIWYACLDNVKNKQQWCKRCAIDETRLTIEDCQKAAEKFGGQCLSKKYINSNTKLEWKCKHNHIWETTVNIIVHKKKWCPRCKNKSQNVLAENIKKIFNCDIKQKYRGFKWLDTKNGGRQEIDIFIPELKIAIEYDGEGHFYPINFGGCNNQTARKMFEKTKKLDKIKNAKMKQHFDDIEHFIRFSYKDDIHDINTIKQKLADNHICFGDNDE